MKVALRVNDGFIDLVEQSIDVAVRIGELTDSTLVAGHIGSSKRVLVANRKSLRSLPKGVKAPDSPEDLQQMKCIVYTELATQNAGTFSAGPDAPVALGTTVTIRARATSRPTAARW